MTDAPSQPDGVPSPVAERPAIDATPTPATADNATQPTKNALKKAAKEVAKAEAKAKKKENKLLDQTTKTLEDTTVTGKKAKSKQGANYNIGLKNTDNGVVTRFPPEPSGYLHIGHAKAALLNDFFAHEQYNGTLILRFDDTNPRNESAEFQDAIVEDLALLGITPDRVSYTSNYFQDLYEYCIKMIKASKAYADDTEKETMQKQRFNGLPSARRDESVESNLARFEKMKAGTEEGQRWCIRAKLSVDSPNKALRDPVIYRCVVKYMGDDGVEHQIVHHRTGTDWKIYPNYDFCCPIVDSLEGVTHALRTTEYQDRNDQYQWMLKALNLRKVDIWGFARLNFIRTLLSKRKLTKLVQSGAVYGWDDPRFPTVRGIRRRGMTVEALREFMVSQGPSRNVVNMDWTIIWTMNKKYIDPVAPRHTAIASDRSVVCHVIGGPAEVQYEEKPKHIKNPAVGTKKVGYSNKIWIEQEDAQRFTEGEEITLMNWGNAYVRKITKSADAEHAEHVSGLELELHLEGDFKKTEKKITWLSDGQALVPVQLVDFDYLITKDKLEEDDKLEDFLTPKTEFKTYAVADCNVGDVMQDDIIQFERKGYFRCDQAPSPGVAGVFFNIPTGKTK
jgi:glutamyl-tRNA synthetase